MAAGGDGRRPELEGRTPGRAAGLDVVDGDARAGRGRRGRGGRRPPRRRRCRRRRPARRARRCRPRPARPRTATTPMAVPVIPSKRPNGCSPDAGDPDAVHGRNIQVRIGSPSGPGSSSPSSRTRAPGARSSPAEAGDHPQQRLAVELDDAEAVGDRPGVARRRHGDLGVQPQRACHAADPGARRRRPRRRGTPVISGSVDVRSSPTSRRAAPRSRRRRREGRPGRWEAATREHYSTSVAVRTAVVPSVARHLRRRGRTADQVGCRAGRRRPPTNGGRSGSTGGLAGRRSGPGGCSGRRGCR